VLILVLAVAWFTGGLSYAGWWLTNSTPPVVALSGPPDAVRGSVQVAVQLPPRTRIVGAQVDGQSLAAGPALTIDTATLPDGVHHVQVDAEDQSFRKNHSQATFDLRTDNTPPQLTLNTEPVDVSQGHTWLLRIQTNEQAAVEATLAGTPLVIQAGNGFGWAFGAIGAEDETKDLPLVATGTDMAGNRTEQRANLHIVKTQWTQDKVDVSAALAPLLAPQIRAAEDAHLALNYTNVTQPKLWDGPFRMPVQGEIVTQLGEVRSYNGGPYEGHHTGVDIAVPQGRPVLAPARARVAQIDKVQLRGNIVILDHGLGVFTTYGHLSEIDVQVGQEIQAGQPFAKVGTTGLSEGPHLHWELWIGGTYVDPLEWTKRSVP
jgi:murein DD-endopeptidase MepM/ murein hydrolase activator NlpD